MTFTTRPEISGTFGVATSTHWIASAIGMSILEKDGNAFDASCAMGFALIVLEPHLNGLGGDLPIIFQATGEDEPWVLCGQGVAPQKATIEHYRNEGLDLIPGSGLLSTVVPGAFDAWMMLLRDYGTMSVGEILAPAIHYAENGHPILARACSAIAEIEGLLRNEWPTSADVWLPGGQVPVAGSLFKNPDLAATWSRLVREAESVQGREAQIDAARKAFYQGFVAEGIDTFFRDAELMDGTGERRKGVLTGEDMASWSASYEAPASIDYGSWTVHKTGPWGQGPVLLQALAILKGTNIGELDPSGPDFVHMVAETIKLVFADREAYYGDPLSADIPLDTLLSEDYAAACRKLIGDTASREQRPGVIPGFEFQVDAALARASHKNEVAAGLGTGEPTMAHLSNKANDTVHLDVIDKWGNIVTATPSGGWLQSSPIVPGLGMAMNSRAQMFWLEPGLPTSLAPGRRPRTTLSPSLASFEGRPELAFGTPGGDQQDQWQLSFFLRMAHYDLNLQENIDMPLFHTQHFQASFYPRNTRPAHLMLEPSFGDATIEELRNRGHDIEVSEPWAVGRLTAARRCSNGLLRAAATPRLMQAYAIGR